MGFFSKKAKPPVDIREVAGRTAYSEYVRGSHYTQWVETVNAFKREGRYDEAERLLLECCDANEWGAKRQRWDPAPWYYEQLAIIYRKLAEPEKEEVLLRRYVKAAGKRRAADNPTGSKLLKRLEAIEAKSKT